MSGQRAAATKFLRGAAALLLFAWALALAYIVGGGYLGKIDLSVPTPLNWVVALDIAAGGAVLASRLAGVSRGLPQWSNVLAWAGVALGVVATAALVAYNLTRS